VKVFGTKADRAEAMRRLGGPDVDAERKKNAMSGDNKAFVVLVVSAALLIGWGVWQYAQYKTACALHPAVDAAEVVHCMDTCSRTCVGAER
jgi:hypothetical protein